MGWVTWHKVEEFGLREWSGGSSRPRPISASSRWPGTFDLTDRSGNQWLLRAGVREFDRQAPLQWKTWMGDYGSLRGYPAGVLTGDGGSWASLDVRLGWDMWRALKVPLLKNWGLQPIGFADYGHTWNKPGAVCRGARGRGSGLAGRCGFRVRASGSICPGWGPTTSSGCMRRRRWGRGATSMGGGS